MKLAAAAIALAILGCESPKTAPGGTTQASPNASILPAPFASATDLTASPSATVEPVDSAGKLPPREPPPPPETPENDEPPANDAASPKDAAGFTMEAAFRWTDSAAGGPGEAPPPALRDAMERNDLDVVIDLAAGRLRLSLDSDAFPLPRGTEFRSRTGTYGHVLVWPDSSAYRNLTPGTVRALFAERRADVTPLLRAKITPAGMGSLLGHRTVLSDVETSLGAMTLEQATLPGGAGGELVCRFLLELIGAEPTAEACRPDRTPLGATFRWTPTGGLSFRVASLVDRRDLVASALAIPPERAVFRPGELPPSPSTALLGKDDLAKLRPRPAGKGAAPSAKAPSRGLLADNPADRLLYLLLDGVPIAWAEPHSRVEVLDVPPGRYAISWRDFLGVTTVPAAPLDIPAATRAIPEERDAGVKKP